MKTGILTTLSIGVLVGCATADPAPLKLSQTDCAVPVDRCPDTDCPPATMVSQGPEVETESGRTYYLDYPCDLKAGEKVTVILSLHGGGSFGNWQRHYFPLVDYVDEHRLVVATPNTRFWSQADDPYLQNIVTDMLDKIGRENVERFWLVGHSMGSFKSRELVCTDYFRSKADGYLSLSGGRIGNPDGTPRPRFDIPPTNDSDPEQARTVGGDGPPQGGPSGIIARMEAINLDCDFSFIFATGEHEPSGQTLPQVSAWADKYNCDPRAEATVVDSKAGYIYDASRQKYGTDAWGRLPRPGTARVLEYQDCDDGRVVADVVRLDKGHTEGLEPHVTETLIELMKSARGGKIAGGGN